jgi:CubicO group peptidase (beta-lactamase class C family)
MGVDCRALFLLCLGLPAVAGASDETRIERVAAGLRPAVSITGEPTWSLAERMQHYKVPGVSITVVDKGKIAWTHVYGLADREAGTPVRLDTLFQAGSVSKPVSAFGAMRLVQAGELDLQQPVNARLHRWKIPENEFTSKVPVTLAHLLGHTGGLTVHGFLGYAPGLPVPDIVAVLDGKAPANSKPVVVDQLPGSKWRYSGGGYTIAQLLMTEATGKDFPQLLQERVLGPIGMRDSTYANPLPARLDARAAAGVLPDGSAVPGKRHTYPEMAAAGLWTTSQDLALFALEMQKALRGESKLLSAANAKAMLVPLADEDYGLGFGLTRLEGGNYFGHNGWDEGFCALLIANRAARQAVVILINANQPAFMEELQRAVAFEYGWPGYKSYARVPASADALASAPGRYRVNGENFATVAREGDRLYLSYGGEAARSELIPVGDNRYMQREAIEERSFAPDANGRTALQFAPHGGDKQSFARLDDGQVAPRELLLRGDKGALAAYEALKAAKDRAGSEDYLNNIGYRLVEQGDVAAGVALLDLNTKLYPTSANTWDSLGYALLAKGDKAAGKAAYEHALSLDPNFPSAKEALLKLQQEP